MAIRSPLNQTKFTQHPKPFLEIAIETTEYSLWTATSKIDKVEKNIYSIRKNNDTLARCNKE